MHYLNGKHLLIKKPFFLFIVLLVVGILLPYEMKGGIQTKRSILLENNRLQFIHITKTGGSTIEKRAAAAGIR